MVDVNENLTKQVAHLARLDLSDLEVKTFTAQLGDILKYVEKLQELDVSHTEPLTHPLRLSNPFRADEVRKPLVDPDGKPKVLHSAPDILSGGFKVPQIL